MSSEASPGGTVTLLPVSDEAWKAGIVAGFSWVGDGIEAVGDVSRLSTGLVITRVEIKGAGAAGITHQLMRKVPLGEVLAAARGQFASNPAAHLHAFGGPSSATLPPGRVQVTDDLLRQVALAYLEESGPGKDRAVLQRLMDRFERPKGTVRTWLNRARDEGWLGPAVQGRVGAEPGPKLLAEFARTPRVAGRNAEGSIVIVAPPPQGAETPEEAQERALQEWRERLRSGGRTAPNQLDVHLNVGQDSDEGEAPSDG